MPHIRLLNRHGVSRPAEGDCCGWSITWGEAATSLRPNIDAWTRRSSKGLDAILITASGCAPSGYGFMFHGDPAYAAKAARISTLAKDVSEFLETLDLTPKIRTGLTVAYHSACSMQHGQQIKDGPKKLLKNAGFKVKDVPEGHICCGSAGVYNILQPEIAGRLRERKLDNIAAVRPDLVATGNIGCITQIAAGAAARGERLPVVHTVELLDWATGGPPPASIARAGIEVRVGA
jgi:glycolate oxidase iron-sulfur subunit